MEMFMTATVYWLHLPTHSDVFSEGYVGVSTDPKNRVAKHIRNAQRGVHENSHLLNAIVKSGNTIIQDTVAVGSEEYCYKLESKLRPQKDIGWNIAEGGSKPPNCKGRVSPFKNHKHTEEEKQKRRDRWLKDNPNYWPSVKAKQIGNSNGFKKGDIPHNATKVKYKGRLYCSLAVASRKTGVSIYYIRREGVLSR